ncbi:MAG TPA: hypothetical protein VNH46_08715, partial [Gemmatimonadales bacterium]|nr:hypothetical protein [Gemmatimonadales bacterium]
VADERPEVELVLVRYARALSAGDLSGMQAIYPAMPGDVRDAWKEYFNANYSLDTSRWRFLEIQITGNIATAKITGTSIERDKKGKQREVPPPKTAHLEKGPGGWRITSIN